MKKLMDLVLGLVLPSLPLFRIGPSKCKSLNINGFIGLGYYWFGSS